MGRTSKRKSAVLRADSMQKCKKFRAGIYARLSSDQDAMKKESIEVQIRIAQKFVEEFNEKEKGESIEVAGYYTDLGKTGSNFKRQGFSALMEDIKSGKINCVIVKDLSRFGRNYLEAGNYIEKIFPFLGVRFIAAADEYDTEKDHGSNSQMMFQIKNLINDLYAKDFSKKAKLQLKLRREEGSYVGGPPPYGYRVIMEGEIRKLIPDENTWPVVSQIYEEFIKEKSYAAVASELNRQKVNPPAVYKKTGNVYYAPVQFKEEYKAYIKWNESAVERILKSETYRGILVQGRTSISERNEANRKILDADNWMVTEKAHKPLIDERTYGQVQKIRKEISEKRR